VRQRIVMRVRQRGVISVRQRLPIRATDPTTEGRAR
jgi:hypothetical protein